MYTELEKSIADLTEAMRLMTRRLETRLVRERAEADLRAGLRRTVQTVPRERVF